MFRINSRRVATRKPSRFCGVCPTCEWRYDVSARQGAQSH